MNFTERFNKGNSQSHAFHALTTTDCTGTDALRKIYQFIPNALNCSVIKDKLHAQHTHTKIFAT